MTSVWPALWPPWNRTTMSACSDSQSTILPLPSSPHWDPTTTTFAIPTSFLPAPRAHHSAETPIPIASDIHRSVANVQAPDRLGPREPSKPRLIHDRLIRRPAHPPGELNVPDLAGRCLEVPDQHAT